MLSNYLIAASRAFRRQKVHFAVNISGLAIGLAAALLVALYAQFESSFDKFQPNADKSYRLLQYYKSADINVPVITPAIHQHVQKMKGVEAVFGWIPAEGKIDAKVKMDGQFFELQKVYAATANLSDFMAIDVLQGSLTSALTQPDRIALSESEAIRFFSTVNAVGKSLVTGNKSWTVAAVFADIPANSHVVVNSIIAASQFNHRFFRNDSYTYVQLTIDADKEAVAQQITTLINDKAHQGTDRIAVKLQPITNIHLDDNLMYDMKKGGSAKTVNICIALSVLLVLIGSFNFINMSTAQAGSRAKEVGVRKSLGASKEQLVAQFLSESIFVALLAGLIGCLMAEIALPAFNVLVNRELSIVYFGSFGLSMLSATLLVGLLAGLYPAFFISSFSAKRVLSGDLQRGTMAIRVRKALMVCQSALSIALIVAASTLYLQLDYLQKLPVGYQKAERLRVLNVNNAFDKSSNELYQTLSKIEGVKSVTPADFDLTVSTNAGVNIRLPGKDITLQGVGFAGTGFNPVETLGLTLLAGRDFSSQYQADWFSDASGVPAASMLISESLLKVAGFDSAEQAIGQTWQFDAGPAAGFNGKIVGVVQEVKIGSTRDPRNPILFVCGLSWSGVSNLMINVDDQDSLVTRRQIENVLQKRLKMDNVEIERVTDQYNAIYQGDRQQAQVVLIFSALAVFLTCVGIFGLAAFSTARRSKEVAIRKVLGSSRTELVNLLAKEYLVLIGISMVIAFPAAFYLVDGWLTNFNDRVSQSPMVYALAAAIVILVTWLTVFSLAFRTASIKPYNTLRQE
jgi:putative ABC transport system permease protein